MPWYRRLATKLIYHYSFRATSLTNTAIASAFLAACDRWLCDEYSCDIRFIAHELSTGQYQLLSASMSFHPIPSDQDMGFHVEASGYHFGQVQLNGVSKVELDAKLRAALSGTINWGAIDLKLFKSPNTENLEVRAETGHRDRWANNELQLQVSGAWDAWPSLPAETGKIDNELRQGSPPFDGVDDLVSWLALPDPRLQVGPTSLTARILPPAVFQWDECGLSDDVLSLTLLAHPKIDLESVALAVRAGPGNGIASRAQVAHLIKWSEVTGDRRIGKIAVPLTNADQALVMIMVGGAYAQRHWFSDIVKARNQRYVAMQKFDPELRMIRRYLLEDGTNTEKFESAVCALLFLRGFNATVQLEKDAPDLVFMTPSGQLGIIECTTRIADFSVKAGKLVDRRASLERTLASSGHQPNVLGVLVCQLPRDQIASSEAELVSKKIVLITQEGLTQQLDAVRFPNDPDASYAEMAAALVPMPPPLTWPI
jgi:hypothetical protein